MEYWTDKWILSSTTLWDIQVNLANHLSDVDILKYFEPWRKPILMKHS